MPRLGRGTTRESRRPPEPLYIPEDKRTAFRQRQLLAAELLTQRAAVTAELRAIGTGNGLFGAQT
eukprot:3413066-Prymnesium_polylepis.1